MTGYTVNTGSTTKFSQNWGHIFGAAPASKKVTKGNASQAKDAVATGKAPAKQVVKKAPAKAAAQPSAAKTGPAKTVKSKQAAQSALTSGKR